MTSQHEDLLKAARVDLIARKVGFALWQLQELEVSAAQCLILFTKARSGISPSAGQVLIEKAQRKTFGRTVSDLLKTKQMSQAVELRFKRLLFERNWLVHQSRSTSRDAVHHEQACERLVERLESIAQEALLLLREVADRVEVFVRRYSITPEQVEKLSAEILKKWHSGNFI